MVKGSERLEHEAAREDRIEQEVAEGVSSLERLQRLFRIVRDKEVRKGFEAFLRTGVNVGITAADNFPGGPGEMGSWLADACKLAAHQFNMPILNTTPDVPRLIAVGSEATEIPTAGAAPSHLLETGLQVTVDLPRIRNAYRKIKRLWDGVQVELNTPEVKAAMKVFKPKL